MDIEEQRLALEKERFAWEQRNARRQRRAVLMPLAAAAVGLLGVVFVQHQESNRAREAAKREFQLAAANIAMDSDTPSGALARAQALELLFKDRLPDDFVTGFDPDDFSTSNSSDRPTAETGLRMTSLIAANPANCDRIREVWLDVFPGDVWVNDIECSD